MGTPPALVLSLLKYNMKTGLAVCCPITSQLKGYPFEVQIEGKKIQGAVLSDHLKILDWRSRKTKFIERASEEVVKDCSLKISALF
jgi:mRNA interferase MazF